VPHTFAGFANVWEITMLGPRVPHTFAGFANVWETHALGHQEKPQILVWVWTIPRTLHTSSGNYDSPLIRKKRE